MAISAARRTAFGVLQKVEGGGYASDLLLRECAALDARDAGLASEIVFGVLRRRAQLDFLIEKQAGPRKLDAAVRTALRMGIYQLRHLDRVPAHAAIGESVELVKRARKVSAAGLVNAVLRRVAAGDLPTAEAQRARREHGEGGDQGPQRIEWPSREVELSCPEWLLRRWERQYGAEIAEGIARAALREPEKYARRGRMQDIGAQAIVPLLGLSAGQTFLDLCAAPGNKTAQAMEAGVRAFACDVHFHRIAGMKGMGAELAVVDGTEPLPFGRRFDRVLVDAPCSGTGTLGRNPEIKWKLREDDLADLQQRQAALLRNALAVLEPGGVLVYSTCSMEREENEDVVAAAGARVRETMQRVPGRDPGDGFFAAVIT
ncbi:MAG TPA: transcription antitermination factor NusB [Bryobacteraceae bacterium]|nr:transcription antitermination factor NusB [Bryobacteraceae bacterium]